MKQFDSLTKILFEKYIPKSQIIQSMMKKNMAFKYHSDDYILSDTNSIYDKKRVIFLDYIIPQSTLYCMIDCRILQSKINLKNPKSLIFHAKQFADNIYASYQKSNIQNFKISSFESSDGFKIKFKSQKQFIESFNNALDKAIQYLNQKKKDYKVLYYISKVIKSDPVKYIDDYIKKIKDSKFKKTILLQNKINIFNLTADNYLIVQYNQLKETVLKYYNQYIQDNQVIPNQKIKLGHDQNGNQILDYPSTPYELLISDLNNLTYASMQFDYHYIQPKYPIEYIICLGNGHLKGIAKYWHKAESGFPCLGFISINNLFKRQGYATKILYKVFQHHKEIFSLQPLFFTYFSQQGQLSVKHIAQKLSKQFNIDIFVTDDYNHYYHDLMMLQNPFLNDQLKQKYKNKKYTFQIPEKVKQKIYQKLSKFGQVISESVNRQLTIDQINYSIKQIYKTSAYKNIVKPYFEEKFQADLQKYLKICLDIYGPQIHEDFYKDTKIIWYQKQLTQDLYDIEIERGKMEDNNVYINQYALIYYLRLCKKQKVYDLYTNLFFLIPHELAHIVDQVNMLVKFGQTRININKQNVHSDTFKQQHVKICGHIPYIDPWENE